MPADPTPTPAPAPSPASPSGAVPAAPARPGSVTLQALSAAMVVAALALDFIRLPHGTTDEYRLMVRLASAFALGGLVVGGVWFLRAPRPRRLQWLWPLITVGVFVFSMFEYGARGR